MDRVTIAILCKNGEATLPLYLRCIYKQDYPRELIDLYIRTNDNTDNTTEILQRWLQKFGDEYHSVHYDDSPINEQIKEFANHDWNSLRFQILGKIRQESISYAQKLGTHYFVADCDNFLKPHVLSTLLVTQKPVVGPYLRLYPVKTKYSNYHSETDPNGYFLQSPRYDKIWHRTEPGIHPVDVIHCTYLIRNEILPQISYLDETSRHEYVIFSHTLRKNNIQQYIDNREVYGYLTFITEQEKFLDTFVADRLWEIK